MKIDRGSMDKKKGRNEACQCGSGKKYKQCCLLKKSSSGKRKLTAKWINAPAFPNLMDRTFGSTADSMNKPFKALPKNKDASQD